MKAITLRNVPAEIARRIERVARTEGISLNKAAIRLLREPAIEKVPEAAPYDDLDALSGTWSTKEADAFDAALRDQRKIDRKMWR
jgi:hypothetical protein